MGYLIEIAEQPNVSEATKKVIWSIFTKFPDLYRYREKRVNKFLHEQKDTHERLQRGFFKYIQQRRDLKNGN